MEKKLILDACCGGRMFWFDKKHPNVLYIDHRTTAKGLGKEHPNFQVDPDQLMDFRALDLPDKSFKMVVFDPPHLRTATKKSYMAIKYGVLGKNWKEDLRKGFAECWRVLDDFGVLIFKWSEHDIKLPEVLKLFSERPLFGHTTGRAGQTIWLCFMKIPRPATARGGRIDDHTQTILAGRPRRPLSGGLP